MRLDKYKQNLKIEGTKVYSYNTHVANISFEGGLIQVLGWWSRTTAKHVNYVAKYFKLTFTSANLEFRI